MHANSRLALLSVLSVNKNKHFAVHLSSNE